MKKFLVIINFLALVLIFGYSVIKEEKMLKKEDTFYIKTFPVDPRSLMQGDYMILNYDISEKLKKEKNILNNGYIRIRVNELKVAEFVRGDKEFVLSTKKEMSIKYRLKTPVIDIGINSYLFQEGKAKVFEKAEYAEVIYTENGKLRLKNLIDENFEIIK